MYVLLYLTLLLSCTFAALFLATYCLIKIVQVSNGFSLLDPDASNGLRIRKWYLLGISLANGLRFISSLVEFVIFSIRVVKDNADVQSMSYYSNVREGIPYVIFVSRMLPSVFFYGNFSLLSLYLAYLHHTMWGVDFSVVRVAWILCNAVALVAALQYIMVYPYLLATIVVFLATEIVLAATITRYAISVIHFLNANSTIGVSRRMTDRFNIFVAMAVGSLIVGTLLHICDIVLPTNQMLFYTPSIIDLAQILLCEVLGTALILSLLSNYLARLEVRSGHQNIVLDNSSHSAQGRLYYQNVALAQDPIVSGSNSK